MSMTTNMKTKRERPWQVLLLLTLLAWLVPQQAVADKLYDSGYFKLESVSSDHFRVKILVADLVDRDDWLVSNSRLMAYSGYGRTGTSYKLVNVYSHDQGDNEGNTHSITACYDMRGATAILVNDNNKRISWDRTAYTITKQDGWKYPQAIIDFYWGPQMAGNTWYIYFEGTHDGDSSAKLIYYLGSVTCERSMGRTALDAASWELKRPEPKKLQFSIPSVPTNNAGNNDVKNDQKHEAWYDLTLTYTTYDGKKKEEQYKYDCGTARSTYDIDIPGDVNNYRSLDVKVVATDAYKAVENGEYFYKTPRVYDKKNYLPTVPVPSGLGTEYHQFDNKVDLTWTAFTRYGGTYNYYNDSEPYVYRIETDKYGTPLSGQSWSRRGTLSQIGSNTAMSYSDKDKQGLQPNRYFKYMVVNVPKAWKTTLSAQLSNPGDDLLKLLGYCESTVVSTAPQMDVYDLQQDLSVTDKVKLLWQYSRIPVSSSDVTFEVWRAPYGSEQWTSIGTIKAKANPAAGTKPSFEDENLENNTVRYHYKVSITINDGVNKAESNVITGSLLSGSSIKTFAATKGTHEGTVRLQWDVKQVGTGNTNYDVYRRYVGGEESDWMRIYTTVGTSESYTYEDNTVQPGYYYDYRVECYSGTKADGTTELSTKEDIGFCQARGVVSGRVTFGSGSTVEDVRITLRPGGEDGDNAVRGYSQRVSDASTGIAWDASQEELSKIFGNDKDYTVQLFVRPDSALSEGAVIAEIPGVGQFVLGPQINNSYQLYCKKDMNYHVTSETYIGNINHFRGIYCDTSGSEDRIAGDNTVYTSEHKEEIVAAWEKEGFKKARGFAASWAGTKSTVLYTYWKKSTYTTGREGHIKASYYDLGIAIPAKEYSALTVKSSNGSLSVSVNDSTSTTMTFAKTVEYTSIYETKTDGDIVMYNGMPISFEGTLVNELAITGWMWQGNVSNLTPDSPAKKEVDYTLPISYEPRFSVGGASGVIDEIAFKGNITEVRVWNHALTAKEQAGYNDRVLSGRESGLALYWPMDEGQDRLVFDASYSNDMPNGRHATVGPNITSSQIVPTEEQLSRYGLTNGNGEYTIRGIPFVGSGSTYTFIPTKGIHTFSPVSRNGFIGTGSLALNGYDYTDESSFPLRGQVTYLNTDIPVDSVAFKIDGTVVQSGNGNVYTDAEGNYEISVPIGNHRIEAWREGHRLTTFPLGSGTHDFSQAEICNFVDSTLVNVTGRINGGFSDKDEPLGFGRSKNRIGQATVKLSLGRSKQSSFNYITDEHGSGEYGTEQLPVKSATTAIASTAYRGAGKESTTVPGTIDNSDTYYIYIKTDPETGEFSALLPPLKYKVESISFDGDEAGDKARYNNLDFFTQNLPMIDATNVLEKKLHKDSLTVDGQATQYYYYSGKLLRQLRTEPRISVSQNDMPDGFFGMEKVKVNGIGSQTYQVPAIDLNSTEENKYLYKYPLFRQNESYDLTINVAEEYYNVDTKETVTEIPSDAQVSITNEASASTSVVAEEVTVNGEKMAVGAVYEVRTITAKAGKTGIVEYSFTAGFPNLGKDHLRALDISVNIDGRTHVWQAPNYASKNTALDLIVLGGIITGTNFVTAGPDHVDMIVRRPPGSTSWAQVTNDTVYSRSKMTSVYSNTEHGGGTYISLGPSVEQYHGSIVSLLKYKHQWIAQETLTGSKIDESVRDSLQGSSYTVTETMKTPAGGTYTQRDGDTFIGRSTNLLFGKGESVDLFRQDDGTFKLGQKESVCTGEEFSTTFVYPHQYIEDVLIPNWQLMIDNFLTHVADPDDATQAVEVPGKLMYYTRYNKGDAAWGKANSDTEFWTQQQIDDAKGYPSYCIVNGLKGEASQNPTDSIEWCINQIKTWKYWLGQNEQDKLAAFGSSDLLEANYSIAGGTSVSRRYTNSTTHEVSNQQKLLSTMHSNTHLGLLANEVGGYAIVDLNWEWGNGATEKKDTVWTTTVDWQLSDAEPTTAFSVDVYKSQRGWGPIFRTRGGQSSQPYEGATYTKYANPGTKLDEATMRVEKPELRINGATTVTDVPTGGQAKFNLQLYNASETNSVCTYSLKAVEGSNPNGAQLFIDGAPLSDGAGRKVRMKGGETIDKQLIVMQSDRYIRDYENIKLVLCSTNDTATVSDPVVLNAHFMPTSAMIDITVDNTVLNQELLQKNGGIITTMRNLDQQDEGLAGLRVRFRKKGTSSWTLAKEWSVDKVKEELSKSPNKQISTAVAFPEDGLYELQAQTFGKYGNQEVTYETEKIEVLQDTHGVKLLGMVSPEDGLLTWLNRNNMHLRFNEELNGIALSKSNNFRIEGGMNNVVADKGRPYPDVALQLNNDSVTTEALYDLSDTGFAFDLWLYRQGDGKIISIGTNDNLLSLSTHNGGLVSASLGDEDNVVDALARLPENTWTYMAMDYQPMEDDKSMGELTLLYATANDDKAQYIFRNEEIEALDCHGKLSVGGGGMQGMVARVSAWGPGITAETLYEKRNFLRAPYTPGLIGYWKMDEGHGTQLTDIARSRHMQMPTESWYINNRNLAAHLDGEDGSALKINVSTFAPTSTDNFAYEMWFRGTAEENKAAATLMSVDNSDKGKTAIGFDKGKLVLNVTGDSIALSDKNCLDGNWHHVALNVRRGTSAIAYLDGDPVKVLPEANVPGIGSHYMTVGATLEDSIEVNRFTGDVDELRIWEAALDGQLIKERMYERMDDSYPGLKGYFPMENVNRNEQGTVTTFFSLKNYGDSESQLKVIYGKLNMNYQGVEVEHKDTSNAYRQAVYEKLQANNAPALKVGSSKMRLADVQYDFTASADEIYLSFDGAEGTLALMDGNDFIATVSNIKDEHGNTSEPVSWKFHCDFASLKWNLEEDNLSKPWNEVMEWQMYIANQTGTAQNYELSGMPTWLTVDKTIGTITGNGGYVTFRLGTDVPVGRHTEYVYLTDQLGISRVLKLNLTVTGDVPDWTVDPDLYESNMTMTGQIYINDRICENSDTRIAAFDNLGLCRGVASPKYVRTRDAYYVDMVLYGASATELSDGTSELTFKVYDASTGTIHPLVGVMIPNKDYALMLQYIPDSNYGSYDAPVVLDVANALQQKISLAKGWTWMSIYVEPLIEQIEWQLPRDKNILKRFKNIKSQTDGFATVDKDGTLGGNLEKVEPGKMYKMQLSTKTDFDLIGLALDVKSLPQTMHPGYNWIGTLSSSVMSVDEAFSELAPEPGDRVKSRAAFAEFSTKGYWEGTLESIVPGQGYIYRSKAAKEKTFHYPTGNSGTANSRRNAPLSTWRGAGGEASHFSPVDPYLYPDNLNIIAVVVRDDSPVDNAEIGAFIDGECRGAIGCKKGHYFLTVMGSSEEDSQKKMELRVWIDGEEYTVDDTLPFISDAFYGSLDEPYVLDVDATAIRVVSASALEDDTEWYTVQGFKIGRKPTHPGVYIHKGNKVTITKQAK